METKDKIYVWNKRHAALLLAAGILAVLFKSTYPLSIAAVFSFHYFIWEHRELLRPYRVFGGYANWVTYIRLLAVTMVGLVPIENNFILVFAVLLIAVLLDGVDGYLARKYKTDSEFGSWWPGWG